MIEKIEDYFESSKTLVTLLFLWLTPTTSANSIVSTFKIYLELGHFPLPPLLPLLCNSLLPHQLEQSNSP